MVATADKRVEVVCSSCGQKRSIGVRQERRHRTGQAAPFRCMLCRFPGRRIVVDDSARLWWLRQFSDAELGQMAQAVLGREPDLERVSRERRRLEVPLNVERPLP